MKRRIFSKGLSRINIIFYAVLSIVVVSLIIVFVVFRDDIDNKTLDNFLDFFRLNGNRGKAEELNFDAGMGNLFALCGEQLAVLSPARMVVYDESGEEVFSQQVAYENPALLTAGDKIITYDRKNPYGLILNKGTLIANIDFPILAADGNRNGQYVLSTKKSGFKGIARYFNEKDQPVFEWQSASYITAVGLSPSGKRMLVASSAQQGTTLMSEIVFLETENTEPLGFAAITDAIVLDAYYADNSHVCILTENGVYFYSDEGALLGEYLWGDDQFLGFYPTEKVLFLHIGPWANKRYGRIVCLNYEGIPKAEHPLAEPPDEIGALDNVCAILQNGWITELFYQNETLTVRAHWETDAVGLLMQSEDNMLLLNHNKAVWNH